VSEPEDIIELFQESITIGDYEYKYIPKQGAFTWQMERYRDGELLDFPYQDVEELSIKLCNGEEIDSYEFKIDTDVDVEEGDVFVIWIGYSQSGLKKRISGPVVRVRRTRSEDEEMNLVIGESWLTILKDYEVTPAEYTGEVADIVKDILSEVTTTSPSVCERKISVAGVETFNQTISISFNEGETLWDALKEIAEVANADFYIDADKVLHFFPAGSKRSNVILQFEDNRTYNCLSFDGSNNYLEIPDGVDSGLNITGPITISVWVKPDSITGQCGIVTSSDSYGGGYALYLRDQVDAMVGFWINDGTQRKSIMVGNIQIGVWTHIVAVYDGTNLVVYINGIPYTGTPTLGTETLNFTGVKIGLVSWIASPKYFDGKLDDIRIYNRALTVDEIISLTNKQHVSDGLVLWLPLDGDVVDKSGNYYTPTNYGASWSTDGFFSTSLTAFDIEETEYYLSTDKIYNRIKVIGVQQETYEPSDKDTWTEYVDPGANGWTIGASNGTPYLSAPSGIVGARCVQGNADTGITWLYIRFQLPSAIDCSSDGWDYIKQYLKVSNLEVELRLQTSDSDYYYRKMYQDDEWVLYEFQTATDDWDSNGSPSWSNIESIKYYCRYYPATFDTAKFDVSRFDTTSYTGRIAVDELHFITGAIRAIAEDLTSQSIYGVLTLVYIDRTITSRTHANLLAQKLLKEYAYPMPVFERTMCVNGLEDINPGETVRVITKDVHRELRVTNIEYRYIEGYEVYLSLTRPMESIETSVESMERDVRKLEVA